MWQMVNTCIIEVCELGQSTPIMFFSFEIDTNTIDTNAHNFILLCHK